MATRREAINAQAKFLQRRAILRREEETCCDCPGCKDCKGFVRNCTCDNDWESLREARARVRPEKPGF